MPTAIVETASGTVGKFHYTISTPTSTFASAIDENIPTVIFLHPVFASQVVFQPQFADRTLRRFNLIGLDNRCHGFTEARPCAGYGPKEAAGDVVKVMEYLKLPPCHFIGVSMGSAIALEIAVLHPNRVLSLALVASLPFEEPEGVQEAREEIARYWEEIFTVKGDIDYDALSTCLRGSTQIMFNNEISRQTSIMLQHHTPLSFRHYNYNTIEDVYPCNVGFFVQPRSGSKVELSRIACPIKIVHFSEDIAYPVDSAKSTLGVLKDAGLDASLVVLEGPQYGIFARWKTVNPVLHDFLVSACGDVVPPIPAAVKSPFLKELSQVGWKDSDDGDGNDSDSDDDFIIG